MLEMQFTGERLVPGKVDYELELEHILRYHFASQFVSKGIVLDAACGTGYGTKILSESASKVFGIDISEEAIVYARNKYVAENAEYAVSPVEELQFPASTFDTVVSFETIEHLAEDSQVQFLQEIKKVLKPDGKLVISTPNHDVYVKRGENHFHIKEMDLNEFRTLLGKYFHNVIILGQQFEVTGIITNEAALSESINSGLNLDTAEYFVAVCSDSQIGEIKSYTTPRCDGRYKNLLDWSISLHTEDIKKNKWIEKQKRELRDKQLFIDEQEREILDNQRFIKEQESLIKEQEYTLHDKQQRIEDGERRLNNIQQIINELNQHSEELQQEVINKDGHIEMLLEPERELNRIKSSRSWRYLTYFWRARDLFLPKASKRRLLVKFAVKFVKSPGRVLKKCTPDRIKKFFYYLKREGVSGVSRRLDECITGPLSFEPIIVNEIIAEKKIEEYEKISFPIVGHDPKVSIIIPVYNQFHYTYECLKSILKNTEDVSYELIIADDCSTDLTQNIEKVAQNIKVIKPEENLRFLRNCNNAAQYCKGEYILFLNNDTQVQQGWLSSLVSLMDSDEKIGLAGSKLVYPDGILQEAGGIIWNDASGWNYGRLSDSNAPEFNYVKEVDYISGAAIMIRRNLWEEIGGFDERFAPAYFEDSDLAFEVRRHGYKVVYQPESVVVHFEGKTNGTDIGSGQKQYQVVNHDKFLEKWGQVLENEHFPNGTNVFLARDRSRKKKTILIIDHYIPQYDKDAGSKTVYQYIKLFADQGFNVKFIGDNFCKQEPYATEISRMGVEILYGAYYSNNWKQWIKENGVHISYVLLNRPHISVKYIDFIRANTNAKIFYYGHDLHFLREMREYDLTGNKDLLRSSEEWAGKEMQLIAQADCAYYPSQVEVDEVLKRDPSACIKAIPAYLFDNVGAVDSDFEKRKDIIFVGGFGHRPNVDAVLWFAKEIMPKLSEHGLKVIIIGSNAPDEVVKLGSKDFIIRGFVTDEELKNYYDKSRLVVVPLRYGAGIKGKVVEAMYNGVPIVTTSVGAEGITGIEEFVVIKDDAEEFAEAIIRLYNDTSELKRMSSGYAAYIRKHFSREAAIEAIGKDFGIIK